jgi:antirestriction protein ArdC
MTQTQPNKTSEALSRLETGVAAIQSSDDFKQYLQVAARFHRYSFNNQILIAVQRPEATKVAGYRAWQELGRQVRKGAKGIQILVPFVPRTKDTSDDDAAPAPKLRAGSAMRFGVGYVFDVADTEGDELPALDYQHTQGETAHDLWRRALGVASQNGCTITNEGEHTTATGYYNPATRTIWHQDSLSLDGRVSTVLHELAHMFDHDAHQAAGASFDYVNHRGERETVAEAVAYVAGLHFGLDTSRETFTYVATWARDGATLKARLGEIQTLANTLIAALETVAPEPANNTSLGGQPEVESEHSGDYSRLDNRRPTLNQPVLGSTPGRLTTTNA